MRRVEIVIDELVLRGVPPERARETAAAVESRLVTLAEGTAPVRDRAEAFRRVEPVTANESGLGNAVADAVWKAIA